MATLFRYKRDFKTPVRGYGSSQILISETDSHSTIIQVIQYKCKKKINYRLWEKKRIITKKSNKDNKPMYKSDTKIEAKRIRALTTAIVKL